MGELKCQQRGRYVYTLYTIVHQHVLIQKLPACSLQRAAIVDVTDPVYLISDSRMSV